MKVQIEFVPDAKEFADGAVQYQQIWSQEGKRMVAAIEKITGLPFVEKTIQCRVNNDIPNSGKANSEPFQVKASDQPDLKRDNIVHELCHRHLRAHGIRTRQFYGDDRVLSRDIPEEARQISVNAHKLLDLVLYDIWDELYGTLYADRLLKVEQGFDDHYREAWEYAIALSRDQRHREFNELKTLAKTATKL